MDATDKKVIAALLHDARLSSKQVARKARIPASTANYRINRLLSTGAIVPTVYVDEEVLGYLICQTLLKTRTMGKAQLAACVRQVVAHPDTVWFVRTAGSFNFIVEFTMRAVDDLERLNRFLSDVFGDALLTQLNLVPSKQYKFETVIPEIAKAAAPRPADPLIVPARHSLDDTDKRILRVLNADARAGVTRIAHEAGVPAATVLHRMKRMRERRIIKEFTLLPDYRKLGYQKYAIFLNLQKDPDANPAIGLTVQQHPNIRYAVRHLGRNSIYLLLICTSSTELFEFLDQFSERFSEIVASYEIFPVFEKYVEIAVTRSILE